MRDSLKYSMILFVVLLLTGGVIIAGCTTKQTTPQAGQTAPVATTAAGAPTTLVIATTTSLYDTGLLNYLEPIFEKQYNVDLKITSQGTGKAIELAKKGDADVLLVHSPTQELAFMKDGFGLNRRSFASNYFEIVGPAADPAGIKDMTPENAFKTLILKGTNNTAGVSFVSRGDSSGTHTAEQNIWKSAGFNYTRDIRGSGKWYVEAGKGMGETLQMASEKNAYALTDEGTFLAYKSNLTVVPLVTSGRSLLNIYSVMTVYNDKQPQEKITMANNFINFLLSQDTQAKIADFGKDKYGKSLFTPMSVSVPDATAGWVADHTSPATDVKPAVTAAATTAAAAATTAK